MGRRELVHPYTGEPLSRGRVESAPKKEKIPGIDLIVAASGSNRRQDLIAHAFPGFPLEKIPLGENEPDTTDPREVVRYKLQLARAIVRGRRREGYIQRDMKIAILAADTQSGPIRLNKRGVPILQHQSKPKDAQAVQRVFSRMAQVAESGREPHYTITSASGVYYDTGKNDRQDFMPPESLISVVYLDPESAARLATDEGFRDYKAEFDRLHSGDLYRGDSSLPEDQRLKPAEITDLAAGLSVPVLTKIGAVTRINEVHRADPAFADEFREAVTVAGAGIDQRVIANVVPWAGDRVASWAFPQRMAEYALGQQAELRPAA